MKKLCICTVWFDWQRFHRFVVDFRPYQCVREEGEEEVQKHIMARTISNTFIRSFVVHTLRFAMQLFFFASIIRIIHGSVRLQCVIQSEPRRDINRSKIAQLKVQQVHADDVGR